MAVELENLYADLDEKYEVLDTFNRYCVPVPVFKR